MKILLVNTFYYPNIVGGTENSIKLLAEGLKSRGYQVAIYCVDNLENGIKKEYINDILVYRGNAGLFDSKVRLGKKSNLIKKIINKLIELRNYSSLNEFKYIISDFKPDIVHTNNLYGISPLFWKECQKKDIKIAHTLRDYWILSYTGNLEVEKDKSLLKKSILNIYRSYFRYQSRYVTAVTAPSEFTLERFLNEKYFFNSRIKQSINNSIHLDINETKVLIDEKKNRKDKVIKFIFVGGLYEIKGIKNLINAFTNIKNDNILLYICGDGDLKEFVKNSSNKDKRIIYKGKLNADELKRAYIESDVLIVPSVWDEPFGRVVIEGNQFGLPVIASNKGGIPEIVKNIRGGELFNSDSVEDLKNKINRFTDREHIKSFYADIENNINKYSIDYQIDSFLTLYNYILKIN